MKYERSSLPGPLTKQIHLCVRLLSAFLPVVREKIEIKKMGIGKRERKREREREIEK